MPVPLRGPGTGHAEHRPAAVDDLTLGVLLGAEGDDGGLAATGVGAELGVDVGLDDLGHRLGLMMRGRRREGERPVSVCSGLLGEDIFLPERTRNRVRADGFEPCRRLRREKACECDALVSILSVPSPDTSPSARHRAEGTRVILRRKNDNLPQTGISAQRQRAASSGALLTWILVAWRAATEPVKEEAMQAILEVSVFGVCSKNVCGYGVGTAIGGRLHPESDSFRVQPSRHSRWERNREKLARYERTFQLRCIG